ncbi:MAG: hypothetical protein GF421_06615 [Candidatus Aminicenantes bacterium]|nr:hypothetical protein [Candidatus Aminicenantes bacterium]
MWIFLGILGLLTSLLIGKAGILFVLISAFIILILEFVFKLRKDLPQNLYFMLMFSPLILLHYSTINDFKIRMLCFLSFIVIISIAGSRGLKIKQIQFSTLKPWTVWILAFFIFSAASFILYSRNVHLSGDEPHYLMVAQSLVEDGDFNLENNIKNKTYDKYLPIEIPFHGKIHQKRYLSYHMPGLSFVMIPFYALFNLLGGFIAPALFFRLAASVINAFFALALYSVLRIQFPGEKVTGIWLLFVCVYPLVFHSVHLYPELPAASLLMGAFIFAFGKTRNYILSGLFLSLVAWFHVKYYPALLILAICIIIQIIKEKKFTHALRFLLFPLINLGLLLVFLKTLYNTFNPADIFPGQGYFSAPMILRVKVFLAYFLDQRDGLLFYSPLFFLFLLGLKKRIKNQNVLIWIGLSYPLLHAFTTVRGAYSPAGRPLMFVSWIFMVLIANFYFEFSRSKKGYGFRWLTGLSLFILFWLFYHPFFIYQPVFSQTTQRASSLLNFLGSRFIQLWTLFPSFLTNPQTGHPANLVWITALVALVIFFYSKKFRFHHFQRHQNLIAFGFFVIFFYLICLHPHVHLITASRYSSEKINFYNNSGNFRYVRDRDGFGMLAGQTYQIFLEPKPGQREITLAFSNTDQVDLMVYNKTQRLFDSRDGERPQFSLALSDLSSLKIKNKTVFPVEIRTRSQKKKAFLFMKII